MEGHTVDDLEVAAAAGLIPAGAGNGRADPAAVRAPALEPAGVRSEEQPGPAAVVQSRETLFRRLLGVADAFAASIALLVSVVVVGGGRLTPVALLLPLLIVLFAKALGLYDRDAQLLHKTTLDEVPRLLVLANATTLLVWLADGIVVHGTFGRAEVAVMWAALAVTMLVLRALARAVARLNAEAERCLFVGDNAGVEEFREQLAASHATKAQLVGWLSSPSPEELEGSALALSERIRTTVAERHVHRVIFGTAAAKSPELLDAVRRLHGSLLKVSLLPESSRLFSSRAELDRLSGITLLGIPQFEMTMSSRLIKRAFDLVGSTLCLLLATPVLALAAIAVKLDSPGPLLYRQRRAGRHGEPFEMFKFRSMVPDAEERLDEVRHLNEARGVFKIATDPRITRAGRLLRALHIDELPQMLNVLRGEMSLVGPRPLPLDEDRRIEGWHRRRLDLSPGVTGPWQVLGSARIPVRDMVKLDYEYVADWSLWNDIRIVLLTFGHVARARGQ